MENTSFTPEQSLEVINQMISNTRQDFKDNGFFYLLWGWFTFIAATLHYVLMTAGYPDIAGIGWITLMPLGGIISAIYGFTKGRKERRRVRTWLDRVMMFTWIAFGASLFIVLTLGGKVGWEVTYPVVILLYGIGTFISGGVLRFLPLILGGIACWVISCIAFFVSFDIQLLLLAGSLLVAYIIPGHLLKYNYNRNV